MELEIEPGYAKLAVQLSQAFHENFIQNRLYLLKYHIPLDYTDKLPPYKVEELVAFYEKMEKEMEERNKNNSK